MSREHARPHPPAGSRRYGGEAEEPAPVPVGVTGHRTKRPRGQVELLTELDPGGERRWPISPPLAPLFDRAADPLFAVKPLPVAAAELQLQLATGY
jgi:hypothetical protein